MNANENMSFTKVDWFQVNAAIQAARAERARILGQALRAAFRGLGRLVFGVADMISRAAQSARLYDELSRMSDRQLADVGIQREDIARIVAKSMSDARAERAGKVVELHAKGVSADLGEVKKAA